MEKFKRFVALATVSALLSSAGLNAYEYDYVPADTGYGYEQCCQSSNMTTALAVGAVAVVAIVAVVLSTRHGHHHHGHTGTSNSSS